MFNTQLFVIVYLVQAWVRSTSNIRMKMAFCTWFTAVKPPSAELNSCFTDNHGTCSYYVSLCYWCASVHCVLLQELWSTELPFCDVPSLLTISGFPLFYWQKIQDFSGTTMKNFSGLFCSPRMFKYNVLASQI